MRGKSERMDLRAVVCVEDQHAFSQVLEILDGEMRTILKSVGRRV